MDHSTTLSQHVTTSREKVWAVISDIPGSAKTLSGVKVTRKALGKDLSENAAKAEAL